MRKELKEISYKYQKKTILNLWEMLGILQEIYSVDFFDYYNSSDDFDKWCLSKEYGDIDQEGKKRSQSNIWFKEWQDEISKGLCKKNPYCCFIDMFEEDIEDLGNDESEKIYHIFLNHMLDRAIEEDIKNFGKKDYRVKLTEILISEFGNEIFVDQKPECN